jgi:Ca-dependent carbohydrate-binding module xylan-binding
MSLVKWSAAAFAAVALGAGVAVAAKAIKADLKSFKWKSAFDGGADLGGYDEEKGRFFLYTNGSATGDITIPEDGEYTITVEASCDEAKKEFAKFKLTVGEVVVAKEHACTTEEAKKYTFTAKLKKGKQPLAVEFLNDEFKEGEYDRNLYLHAVTLEKK